MYMDACVRACKAVIIERRVHSRNNAHASIDIDMGPVAVRGVRRSTHLVNLWLPSVDIADIFNWPIQWHRQTSHVD